MNDFYDSDKARKKLEDLYEERSKFKSINVPQIGEIQTNDIRFEGVEYPPSSRIMTVDEEGEHVEVIMKMQGVLCASMLPPFRRTPSGNTLKNIRQLRQFVKITGFGAPAFQEAYDILEATRKQLQAQTIGQRVLPGTVVPYEGHTCVEAHARYFTDRNLIPFEKNQGFSEYVDPFNVLADLKPDEFIHGQDNKVDYVSRTTDKNGCIRHVPMDPSVLRGGDIIEIAFSCVGIPIKDKRMMMILNLRAVTLLDDSIRKEAERNQRLSTTPAPRQKIVRFKRRLPYVDLDYCEEEGERVKKGRTEETR